MRRGHSCSRVLDWSTSCLRLWISKEWDVRGHTSCRGWTPIGLRLLSRLRDRLLLCGIITSTWNAAGIHISFGLRNGSLSWWRGCTKLRRLTSWGHIWGCRGWQRKHLRGRPIIVVISHQIGGRGWCEGCGITIVMKCSSIHRYVRWCIDGDRSWFRLKWIICSCIRLRL